MPFEWEIDAVNKKKCLAMILVASYGVMGEGGLSVGKGLDMSLSRGLNLQ